jgi:hypothetical protein
MSMTKTGATSSTVGSFIRSRCTSTSGSTAVRLYSRLKPKIVRVPARCDGSFQLMMSVVKELCILVVVVNPLHNHVEIRQMQPVSVVAHPDCVGCVPRLQKVELGISASLCIRYVQRSHRVERTSIYLEAVGSMSCRHGDLRAQRHKRYCRIVVSDVDSKMTMLRIDNIRHEIKERIISNWRRQAHSPLTAVPVEVAALRTLSFVLKRSAVLTCCIHGST